MLSLYSLGTADYNENTEARYLFKCYVNEQGREELNEEENHLCDINRKQYRCFISMWEPGSKCGKSQ